MVQQRFPDTLDEVFVIDRISFPIAKHILRKAPGSVFLPPYGRVHHARHLDIALRAVGFGVVALTQYERLANQDQPPLKIDVFPLQAVDFAGAHAGKESH
jgi:hypothetical protein